jgi:hypothetical protein
VRRFKFTQEVAGADEVDAFADDHPPTHDIAVLEQKQRLGFGIGAENSIQRFECRGLTKPAGRRRPSPQAIGGSRNSSFFENGVRFLVYFALAFDIRPAFAAWLARASAFRA